MRCVNIRDEKGKVQKEKETSKLDHYSGKKAETELVEPSM
jgi:hypothetical protein